MEKRPYGWLILLAVLIVAGTGAAAFYVGYRIGVDRAFYRDTRLAESPEPTSSVPAVWKDPPTTEPAGPPPAIKTAPAADVSAPAVPFAIDVTKPIRISWPLDIGPDISLDATDPRVCLRARQGVNEIQTPGSGAALYAFRVKDPGRQDAGRYQTLFRVRWTSDGVGHVGCSDSWFAGIDDAPLEVIGRKQQISTWFWERGPDVELAPGVHWLRVELREDGPVMDRVVVARAGDSRSSQFFDRIQPTEFTRLAGEAPSVDPQHPVKDVEISSLPTRSLVIGKGHVNEITVIASWQGRAGGGFTGTIEVGCPTAPGLTVSGVKEISCGPDKPFAKNIVRLRFPDRATRRFHYVRLSVRDKAGAAVFHDAIRFQKGCVWAFLGPFRSIAHRAGRGYRRIAPRGTGSILKLEMPCDKDPVKIAHLADAASLGLDAVPLARGRRDRSWKVISDGSCYDWTGSVDLRNVYGATGPAFAYAVTWIRAERDLSHRSFNFQVDDSGWLWVNGRTIATLPVDLPREANRLWSSGTLGWGPNPVVVKVAQITAYWGFRFDVVDWHWQGRRGDVITGIEQAQWPKPHR